MKSTPLSMACCMAGPGSPLFELITCRSHPSACVAAFMPTVMYGHDSSSHSSHAIFFLSGFLVSGLVTPIWGDSVVYLSTTDFAAASPVAPAATPLDAVVVAAPPLAAAAVVVAPPAAVVAAPPLAAVVPDELLLLLSLPHAAATRPATATTASRPARPRVPRMAP